MRKANVLERLGGVDRFLNRILMVIAGAALVVLMLLGVANVVMRILHVPLVGTYEVVGFLSAVVVALALGPTQEGKDHFAVDVLTKRFPEKVNRAIERATCFVTMVFFAVVARQVFLYAMTLRRSGEVSETLKIIYHPFVYCVSLGFALLALALLVDLAASFRRFGRP